MIVAMECILTKVSFVFILLLLIADWNFYKMLDRKYTQKGWLVEENKKYCLLILTAAILLMILILINAD